MKLTLNWLKDYVEIKIPAKELADKLTMVGLEVTSLEKISGDYLFDIEVTTNRSDCLSVIGIAREVAAITNKKLKVSRKSGIPLSYIRCSAGKSLKFKEKYIKHKTLNIKQPSIKIEDKKGCRFYSAQVIADVEVKPSPEWLRRRLELVGIRPINNIVDITNYVLMETGQPLHAFDYDKLTPPLHVRAGLTANRIIVRRTKEDEKIVTIDGVERRLNSSILVIADADKPIAVAGIMGGQDTQVTNQTKNILLESAYFDPAIIRRAVKLLGITTESSYRFERGVDPKGVLLASDRAVSLILKLATGKLVASKEKRQRVKCRHREIVLRVSRANQILGLSVHLSGQEIKRILGSLQIKVISRVSTLNSKLKVIIPSFRQDLTREIDLIEELIRIYGYDKIPSAFPYIKPTTQSPQPRNRIVESLIREVLVSRGLNEVITYSLLSLDNLKRTSFYNEKNLISIRNPLSCEQELMRPSLIPGLLNATAYNLNRQLKDIKIFELGHIYSKYTTLKERLNLAIAITGKRYDDWLRKSEDVNFFDLKGKLEVLFERLGISDLKFSNKNYPFLSDDKSASIKVDGDAVGFIGQVSKRILEEFDLTEDIWLTEILLDNVLPHLKLEKRFKPLPKYPFISRDMAIVVKEEIPSSQVTSIITEAGGSILSELRLFDQYYGEQIPQGSKSLAYCLRYYLKDRTLTDNEVTQLHNKICQELMEKLGAKIR